MNLGDSAELVVLNKIDVAPADMIEGLQRDLEGVPVSAAKRVGIGELLAHIDRRLHAVSSALGASVDHFSN
jgi:50S ribosomal subunit-associated GTPase HflX